MRLPDTVTQPQTRETHALQNFSVARAWELPGILASPGGGGKRRGTDSISPSVCFNLINHRTPGSPSAILPRLTLAPSAEQEACGWPGEPSVKLANSQMSCCPHHWHLVRRYRCLHPQSREEFLCVGSTDVLGLMTLCSEHGRMLKGISDVYTLDARDTPSSDNQKPLNMAKIPLRGKTASG